MAEVITLVPSIGKRLQVTGAGLTRVINEPEEIVRGFGLMLGEEDEINAWIETYPQRYRAGVRRRLEPFRRLQGKEVTILGVMGGLGQALFIRAADMKIPVGRIPMFHLQTVTGIAPKSTAKDRSQALEAAWSSSPDRFYPIAPVTPSIAMARELVRERLAIQDLRKPMQLRFYSALREMRYLLPAQAGAVVNLIEKAAKELFHNQSLQVQIEQAMAQLAELLPENDRDRVMAVTRHYANPRFIIAARDDEIELETQIVALLGPTPIWRQTHAGPNSSLPQVKGFAAALGGGTIAEIGDIRRFPHASYLRSYARFGLTDSGGFPRRVRGTASSWNFGLNRAMWFWSTDQVGRYDHIWRELLLWKKARELQAHPEPMPRVVVDQQGRERTVYDYTLKHLHARACRWTGSQLLEYLFRLWDTLERGQDPEGWYLNSSWPAYFGQAEGELARGLRRYLEEEIPRRRKVEPVEDDTEGGDEKQEE